MSRTSQIEREAYGFGEFGELLGGVSLWTVRRLVDAGAITAFYVGARRLISKSELERVLSTGAVIPRKRKSQESSEHELVK